MSFGLTGTSDVTDEASNARASQILGRSGARNKNTTCEYTLQDLKTTCECTLPNKISLQVAEEQSSDAGSDDGNGDGSDVCSDDGRDKALTTAATTVVTTLEGRRER